MSFDARQFRALVTRELTGFDPQLATPAAVNLVLGTAAVESEFGRYLRQLLDGPARGAFQMEPKTWDWLRSRFGTRYPSIDDRECDDMEWDLRLAAIGCRLRYLAAPPVLPDAGDVRALGSYWKAHYNTRLGRGTVEGFVDAYRRFVR